jgi:hypothetical protein
MTRRWTWATVSAVLALGLAAGVRAEQAGKEKAGVPLVEAATAGEAWEFSNGPEFPGATGKLEVEKAGGPGGKAALRLRGDFSGGGNYVAAGRSVPQRVPDMLSFMLKHPGATSLTLRLTDSLDTVHQVSIAIARSDDWRRVEFPAQAFFERMGMPDALEGIRRYEKWGDNKKKGWQPPLKAVQILLSRRYLPEGKTAGEMMLADFVLRGREAAAGPKEEAVAVKRTIRLDDVLRAGHNDWKFWKLGEGVKGSLEVVKDQPAKGRYALRLTGDFTEGNRVVGMAKGFADLKVQTVEAIRLRMMSPNIRWYNLQIKDATGQTHQRKWIKLDGDGKWHDVTIDPEKIAGGEHWGGANDAKLHQPVRGLSLMLRPDEKTDLVKPVLHVADISADVTVMTGLQAASFREGFEDAASLKGWQLTGEAARTAGAAAEGKSALRLTRPLDRRTEAIRTVGPKFTAVPGSWLIAGSARGKLHSPDNSYHGLVQVEWLNGAGKVIEAQTVEETYDEPAWAAFSKQAAAPAGTLAGRLVVTMRKTYGWFEVDGLTVRRVAPPVIEQRIDRIGMRGRAVGNLFLPEQTPVLNVKVSTYKPLTGEELKARYVIRDYWGAEHAAGEAGLKAEGFKRGKFGYAGQIELSKDVLAVGKYYEAHVSVTSGPTQVSDYRGLARLPEAASHKYAPQDIPFSIRNWDGRIREWVGLANRIGLRQVGLWVSFRSQPPYKPGVPQLDTCAKFGMQGVGGMRPVSFVERGNEEYTEQALREGTKALLETFPVERMPMITLGNEPHGGPAEIKRNVAAYRAVYEAAKAASPRIFVVGTSVGPDERYFQAGYHKYLDAYDFHIYQSYRGIPRHVRRYRELMEKYDAPRPVFCTEMGLNSQGMPRRAVAVEMIKKFAVFFAAGGARASWFTIMYPDPKGTARGSSGDSHCVFDCKYREYNPRLDAVTHYHVINTLLDKKFVAQRAADDGTEAFLFANKAGECLLILWNEKAERAAFIPLPGVKKVRAVRIDGSDVELAAAEGGVTLNVGAEPLLIVYEQAEPALPEKLAAGRIRFASGPAPQAPGAKQSIVVQGPGLAPGAVRALLPPGWKVRVEPVGTAAAAVRLDVTAPAETAARYARLAVRRLRADGAVSGEIVTSIPLARKPK